MTLWEKYDDWFWYKEQTQLNAHSGDRPLCFAKLSDKGFRTFKLVLFVIMLALMFLGIAPRGIPVYV